MTTSKIRYSYLQDMTPAQILYMTMKILGHRSVFKCVAGTLNFTGKMIERTRSF